MSFGGGFGGFGSNNNNTQSTGFGGFGSSANNASSGKYYLSFTLKSPGLPSRDRHVAPDSARASTDRV
jgi:hypothetical protein